MTAGTQREISSWLMHGHQAVETNDRAMAYHCMAHILELYYAEAVPLEGEALNFYLILLGADALVAEYNLDATNDA